MYEILSAYFFVGALLVVACLANDLSNKNHNLVSAYLVVFFLWPLLFAVFVYRALTTK